MTEKHYIILHETVLQSWLRDAGTAFIFISVIGIGWLIESSAMQWAGMLVVLIALISKGINSGKHLSIDEARKKLDEIEQS